MYKYLYWFLFTVLILGFVLAFISPIAGLTIILVWVYFLGDVDIPKPD